jgi:hypothetical protein
MQEGNNMNALIVMAKDKLSKGASGTWEEKDKGWIAEYFDKKSEDVDKYIDKSIDKMGDKITNKLAEYGTFLVSDLISMLEVGAIGYGMYQCVHTMWLGNKSSSGKAKPMDKIMFSYFMFFILRITNTVIKVRGGLIGK